MQRLAERGVLLGAAEAWMPGSHRPRTETDVAESDRRAVGVGLRTLAADLVETEALTMSFVAEFEREAPGIEMRPPLAVLVDQAAIGEFRSVLLIEFGRPLEGQHVQDCRQEIVGAGRAAGNIDHEFAGNDGLRADRAGRIWVGRLDAAPRSARSDGDDGGRALSGFADRVLLGFCRRPCSRYRHPSAACRPQSPGCRRPCVSPSSRACNRVPAFRHPRTGYRDNRER